MVLVRWCGGCATEVAFSVVDVVDCPEHEADCVEVVCCACGAGYEAA